jgi:hypothetical protein
MSPIPRRALASALSAVILALAPAAQATVVRYLTLADQLELSQLVVRVKVGESRVFVDEKDGRPRTETQLTVLEVMKGDVATGQNLTIRQMRGSLTGEKIAIAGDPEFREGQQAVLFLTRDEDGIVYLAALGQSFYKVQPNLDGKGSVVIRDLDGLGFYVGGMQPRVTHGLEEAPIPLRLFETTVREISKELER